MNYTLVVVAVVALLSGVAWMGRGRREFRGPLDMDDILFRTRAFRLFEQADEECIRLQDETVRAHVVAEEKTGETSH